MARRPADPNLDPKADDLTDEQAAAPADPPAEEEAVEPKKGQLTGNVIKDGTSYPPGTKASELDLSDEEKARLDRLGLIK